MSEWRNVKMGKYKESCILVNDEVWVIIKYFCGIEF